MALIYYDSTISNSYELIMDGLREYSKAVSIIELGQFVSNKTQFPASVCHKIIMEALAEGMASKTIRQLGERYYALPGTLHKLPKTRKPHHAHKLPPKLTDKSKKMLKRKLKPTSSPKPGTNCDN